MMVHFILSNLSLVMLKLLAGVYILDCGSLFHTADHHCIISSECCNKPRLDLINIHPNLEVTYIEYIIYLTIVASWQ